MGRDNGAPTVAEVHVVALPVVVECRLMPHWRRSRPGQGWCSHTCGKVKGADLDVLETLMGDFEVLGEYHSSKKALVEKAVQRVLKDHW